VCPLKMQESPEDYLETIYMLSLHSSEVRSIDVARHLGYSKPSVSVAMKRLRENGYVNMDDNNLLTLTESGLAIARSIYERHQVISGYLMSIGVSEETALKDACRIEHVLSEETFHKIKEIFYQTRKDAN
jgi:Mn-dependent DtxR family transcriptional regulator